MPAVANKAEDVYSLPDVVDHQPSHIWIEPTNRCNTRCTHCGHFYSQFGEDMAADLYEKIEAEVLDHVKRAELIGYGEPFMGKNFMRMFDACVERGIEIYTTSNGILLRNSELTAKVVRNNVHLCLSIDGATPETFEFVRPYVKWKGLMKTLEMLKQETEKAGDECRYTLRFNFVAMRQNLRDVPRLVEMAHEYGAKEVFVLPLGGEDVFEKMADQSPFRDPEAMSESFREALPLAHRHGVHITVPESFRPHLIGAGTDGPFGGMVRWMRRAQLAMLYIQQHGVGKAAERLRSSGKSHKRKASATYCNMPWNDAYFASDGTVFPCCIMGEKLGDMRAQPWPEIWNGQAYRSLRRTIHSWNPSSVCRKCALPTGINGGDEKFYENYFSMFAKETVVLTDASVALGEGFHPVEFLEDGAPSHSWMSREGTMQIDVPAGAKFLRIITLPKSLSPTMNPGVGCIDDLEPEPFDDTADRITFPVEGVAGDRITLRLTMENEYTAEGDSRQLALLVRGFEFLK